MRAILQTRARLIRWLLGLAAWLPAGCVTPMVPDPPDANIIPASNPRVAFQSQCALNVVECTSSWPTAVVSLLADDDQMITEVTTNSYTVEATGNDSSVSVQFVGSASIAGDTATFLGYSWSYGATDDNPCTLNPGTEIGTEEDIELQLAPGFHYIRLFVINNVVRDEVASDACGVIARNTGSYHFVEVEVEVRMEYAEDDS